jgi:quercetin dioxygenase-like cupin family protein
MEFMTSGSVIRPLPFLLLGAACALADSTVAIDNPQVKVIKAMAKPDERTPLHEHKFNRVIIYEQAGRQEILDTRKNPHTNEFKAGEVQWSPGGGMHVSRITTPNVVPMVEIELKTAGRNQDLSRLVDPERRGMPTPWTPGPLDPVKVDPKHYKVEFENNQVRVLRVTIGPHESTPVHQHSVNRVVTYLTDQNFRITSQDGTVETAKHGAGDVTFSGPATHKEENLNDKPFEVVVTEIKN